MLRRREQAAGVLAPLARIPVAPWLIDFAIAAWAAVSAFCLLRLAWSYARLEVMRRRTLPVDSALEASVQGWAHRMGIVRHVSVRTSAHLASPIAIGLYRPIIVIPERILKSSQPSRHRIRLRPRVSALAASRRPHESAREGRARAPGIQSGALRDRSPHGGRARNRLRRLGGRHARTRPPVRALLGASTLARAAALEDPRESALLPHPGTERCTD